MKLMRLIVGFWLFGVLGALGLGVSPAEAQYGRTPDSEFDPTILSIEDRDYLGVKIDHSYRLVDHEGKVFSLSDMLGKPMILVLSYYQCDGTCSVINQDLKSLLENTHLSQIGRDYRVLTLTFNKNDTLQHLQEFRQKMDLPEDMAKGWTFAMLENPEDIAPFTSALGFRFFWSPRDRTFFHPGVFIVTSPAGRVTRYLYALSNEAKDVDLAVTEARSEQMRATPKELLNLAVSLCYSYNFHEGRYTINYPLFIAAGSLFSGVAMLAVAMVVYHRRRRAREACQ